MAENQLIPGQPLRNGVDLVADKKTGALIVIGTSAKLEKISSGGITLNNCSYTPEMLSELAKMDGAIIVDANVNNILKANVHLNPSDNIPTSQTGTRHRTAERVSVETELSVIAVSEESSTIKVFSNNTVNELEESSIIFGKVNESLQSIDRTRRRFDDAVLELGELEVENTLTNQQVLEVIQRGELLGRLSHQVRKEATDLGEDSGLVMIQIDSLESGVRNTLDLVLKDHLPAKRFRNINKAVDEIANLTYEELNSIQHLGSVLFMESLDEVSTSKGYRILARLPGLPDNLHDSLIQKFKTLPNLLTASTDKLFEVEGIGRSRAQQLREYFDTLLKNVGFSYINGH
ncbi:MAG: DNA integrity scanning diadenylate cyclase DisA [Actinomycetota bacterium]|jgi:diadenylate cyclase|nr:DNA integrity scanning protein DisA [Actinomycetota bacterium]MEC7892467.1 DNA integrity scanning diadenylate cyclase DisA [Actinomycetota bacterium]|tara:strand:+ start:64 stop:1104 length:1041 start_codon:yes stop_codon:yes gene_type:complete